MLFSVLLPTYNRLEYLRYAIETVCRQDYSNWEIIVSDNCSVDNIEGYVQTLADPRIKYFRTAAFVPVTDNWNNALAHSSGDYVVMLGDDDGLLPGYFSNLLNVFQNFPDPDFVYVSAYFFAYPGAVPDAPNGFLRRDRNLIFTEGETLWLRQDRAKDIAMGYLDFRMPVASNMQFSLISRRKIDELTAHGPFFQSPYPDFYATPMLFLTSSRILIHRTPLVIVGITQKSYGFYHFNNKVQDGTKILNNEQSLRGHTLNRSLMLPGTPYYDSWLLAMEAIRGAYSGTLKIIPNYRRYRFLQIVHVYKRYYFDHLLPRDSLEQLKQKMRSLEKLLYGIWFPIIFGLMTLVPRKNLGGVVRWLRSLIGQHPIANEQSANRSLNNLMEVFDAHDGNRAEL